MPTFKKYTTLVTFIQHVLINLEKSLHPKPLSTKCMEMKYLCKCNILYILMYERGAYFLRLKGYMNGNMGVPKAWKHRRKLSDGWSPRQNAQYFPIYISKGKIYSHIYWSCGKNYRSVSIIFFFLLVVILWYIFLPSSCLGPRAYNSYMLTMW